MKKRVLFLAIFPLLFSCSFSLKIPESVSAKTNADYNLTIGKFESSLDKYLSKDSILDLMQKTGDENSAVPKYKVYEYRPKGDKFQQFVVDFSVKEIPLDVASYIKDLDFDKDFSNNFTQEFPIPAMNIDGLNCSIPVSDNFTSKIISNSNGKILLSAIKVPRRANTEVSLKSNSAITQTIKITAPVFSTMTFVSGSLNVTAIANILPAPSEGYSTNLKFVLKNPTNNQEITSVDNINLGANKTTEINFPLAGKTLLPAMELIVEGTVVSGTSSGTVDYSLSAKLDSNSKFKKITGLSMSKDQVDSIMISQKITITTDDSFKSCIFGDKDDEKSYLSMKANFPDGWSGVKTETHVDFPKTEEKSELCHKDTEKPPYDKDFEKIDESGNYILNRRLPLKDRKFEKNNICIEGNSSVEFENATIIFKDDGSLDDIPIDVKCDVKILQEMQIELKEDQKKQTRNEYNESMSVDQIKALQLTDESVIKINYKNDLPEGNDFPLKLKSDFLGLPETSKTMAANSEGTLEYQSSETPDEFVVSDSSKIDITATLDIDSDNDGIILLKNVEVNKTYKVELNFDTDVKWEYVIIKSSEIDLDAEGSEQTIDTNINMKEIFSGLSEKLGDAEYLTRINFKDFPIFMYVVVPDISVFKGQVIQGSANAFLKDKAKELISDTGAEGLNVLKSLPPFEFDETDKDIVVGRLEKKYTSKADLAELVNYHEDANIMMKYKFAFGDFDDGEVKIYSTELEQAKADENSDSVNVQIHVRLVMPFLFQISKDGDGKETPVEINLKSFMDMDADSDLFSRSEALEVDDFEKYLAVIDKASLNYNFTNQIIQYNVASLGAYVAMATEVKNEKGKNIEYVLKNGNGECAISGVDFLNMLKTYPVRSDLKFVLPCGDFYIPIDPKVQIKLNVQLVTDGTIKFF